MICTLWCFVKVFLIIKNNIVKEIIFLALYVVWLFVSVVIIWLSDIKDYIDALLKYGDFDFVIKACKINNIKIELIRKLYNYFYDFVLWDVNFPKYSRFCPHGFLLFARSASVI